MKILLDPPKKTSGQKWLHQFLALLPELLRHCLVAPRHIRGEEPRGAAPPLAVRHLADVRGVAEPNQALSRLGNHREKWWFFMEEMAL